MPSLWSWFRRRPPDLEPNPFEVANAEWLRLHRALEFHVRKHQCAPDCVARQRIEYYERLYYHRRETALD